MKTRAFLCAAVLVAGCGQPQPEQDAPAPPAPAPAAPSAPEAALSPASVVGVWSFDRSCASGDGMRLAANGEAGFDEWGVGAWSLDAENNVVLDLRRQELGVEMSPDEGEPVRVVVEVRPPVGDDLRAEIRVEGEAVRTVNARRCPES